MCEQINCVILEGKVSNKETTVFIRIKDRMRMIYLAKYFFKKRNSFSDTG